MPPKGKEKTFVLVRWLEDETVSVMPLTAIHQDFTAHVGAVVRVKWSRRKYYDAEILKISRECVSGNIDDAGVCDCTSILRKSFCSN